MPPSFSLNNLSFSYTGASRPLLREAICTIPINRIGIVGDNGSGKSTLLRLLAGELTPTAGTLTRPDDTARLSQQLLTDGATVASVLGIQAKLDALAAIESGSVDVTHFETVGDDWDIAARSLALLAERVPTLSGEDLLARPADSVSGGELVTVALTGLELSGATTLLLDEPTNNLDSSAKTRLLSWLTSWRGGLVVVSHDAALLRQMSGIVELRGGTLRYFGGNLDTYRQQLALEQASAERAVIAAAAQLRTERRLRMQVQTATARQDRRDRGRFATVTKGPRLSDPTAKSAAKGRRDQANKQAGQRVAQARTELDQAQRQVRKQERITVAAPTGMRPISRLLGELVGTNQRIQVVGGMRLGLVGDNGVGKSTMLASVAAALPPERVGWLDQQLRLPEDLTVFECLRQACPMLLPSDLTGELARFLLRGDQVHQPVATLSGGERFRLALARLLLADPPPELLLLDEPSNNLDFASIDALVAGLAAYPGALIVVSHDPELMDRLELHRVLHLDASGELSDV